MKQKFNVHVMFLGGSKLRSFKQVISYRYVLYTLHKQHNGIENIESKGSIQVKLVKLVHANALYKFK